MGDDLKPGEIAVDLDSQEKKTVEPKAEVDLSAQLEKLSKTVNFLSAGRRHDDSLEKKINEIYEKLNTKEPETTPENLDEIDQLAQKDWKKAVETLADRRFEERMKKEREQDNLKKTQEYLSGALEKSKLEVMSRHPEIETDPTSEKAQIFQRIVQAHPDYLTNPYGPKLAMNDMEDELRTKGWLEPDIVRRVEKEAERRSRVVKTNISKDRAVNEGKITLDATEQEFCKTNDIPYEDYAKNKKTLLGGGTEGVTVNG